LEQREDGYFYCASRRAIINLGLLIFSSK